MWIGQKWDWNEAHSHTLRCSSCSVCCASVVPRSCCLGCVLLTLSRIQTIVEHFTFSKYRIHWHLIQQSVHSASTTQSLCDSSWKLGRRTPNKWPFIINFACDFLSIMQWQGSKSQFSTFCHSITTIIFLYFNSLACFVLRLQLVQQMKQDS